MDDQRLQDATYLLRKLLVTHGRWLVDQYPWVSEHERWKELVFALLGQCMDQPESELRGIVDELDELGLLEPEALAQVVDGGGLIASTTTAQRILELLGEEGVAVDDARRCLHTLGEAARLVQEEYQGKVQLFLRRYGEQMLRDAAEQFRFTSLDQAATTRAFTLWIQNVLGMPVSLYDDALTTFSAAHGLEPADLVRAADELDLNVAVLDDIIQQDALLRSSPEGA